ncbi:MAG: 3-hydroxyacyl-CoA dehydrogenase NAD-binding domain-containing protein, partial [Syntrophomonadaceae bacterium]|nr:3-hydroxyacyl-CoA dehydrogenase NAD-binding domain-containing protein [Syntrophomonadaceae bacterium]
MNTIGVLGAGVMGTGVAQLAAQAGYAVIIRDLKQSLLKESLKNIRANLEQQIDAGQLEPVHRDGIVDRIRRSTDL